jgi:uncharacterized membrane protein
VKRLRGALLDLLHGLWFVPACIVVLDGALAVALVEVDRRSGISGGPLFQGDASAARTLLSVISGSLITVAGLTLSLTMVVLQLTSSQFSPRILRNFFGDRMTQVTVGSYVGIFVYSVIVLRSVSNDFVPRLSVTVASLLAIAAVVLLIVFIHHVSQLIQVSHVTGEIGVETLARLDVLYPETGIGTEVADADALLEAWYGEQPGLVMPARPGYLRRVELDALAAALPDRVERAAVLVCPGDFVGIDQPLLAVWPAEQAGELVSAVRGVCRIEHERDVDQDLAFGLSQLTETAVKAMSPGINDPTTACTCVGYIRSILVRLAGREFPARVMDLPERPGTIVVRRRAFEEHLESLIEIGRYSSRDVRVTRALLEALRGVLAAARRAGFDARAAAVVTAAFALGSPAREAVPSGRDREAIDRLLEPFTAG